MRRLWIVCLLLTVSVLLLVSPARAATWTATITTTIDLVAGPARTAAFLAPDGSQFAYFKGKDLCMYSLTGEKGNCVTMEGLGIDLETVRWSPDSTKLAYSEDFIRSFRDSDIWLYDTATNTLKDITPDPNRDKVKHLLTNTDPTIMYTIDMIPQWSSDSQSIVFIRYTFNKIQDAHALFYKLNLKDNSTQEIASADTNYTMSTYGFALSPDDSTIAYNLDTRGSEKDGTWFLDVATGKAKFAAAPVQETAPWTYQYSPDGKTLLTIGVDLKGGAGLRKPEESPMYTLPVSGGRQQDLNTDIYVLAAGWGHDGTTLAYTTLDSANRDKEGLYITSAPGQPGDMVLPGRFIVPTGEERIPIVWAANDTILLTDVSVFKLVVVHLKQSE